jgi:hypothetical protein
MKEISLRTRSVAELAQEQERFYVPNYQRGYRWEADQVTALLDDLAEFEAAPDPRRFYCLQPLVVVRRGDEWEVVDGQQRLTTIFLILKRLSANGAPPFSIRYERHPEGRGGLHGLLQAASPESPTSNSASPDLYYLRKADAVIETWLEKHKGLNLPSLTNREGAGVCAKFIWQELETHHDAIRAFTRLNAGKIRLEDSELIRASFLRRRELDEDDRHHIALRWDQMECRLQQSEFWAYLVKKGEPTDSRIGLLFRLLAQQKKWVVTKDREIFGRVFDHLKNIQDRRELWQAVEDLFGTLEEWFEENRLFHLIGFLVELGEPVASLLKDAATLGKKEFTHRLKKKIRERLLVGIASRTDLETYLKRVEYAPEYPIKALLLCLNLATLDADKTGTVRLSFHAYKTEEWDIEHIRATATRPPESVVELKAALGAMRDYVQRSGLELDDAFMQLVQADLEKQSEKGLEQLYSSLRDRMEGPGDLGASNGLGNLSLLDAGTNRGYGNSPFAVKRAWVLGLDQQAKYLLPCTRNVFTKSYSKAPINLLHWTPQDAEDYLSSITQRMTAFFSDTWEGNA